MGIGHYLLLMVYLLALFSLFVYGINCYFLMIYYRINRPKASHRQQALKKKFFKSLPLTGWPKVTIQLPIYNERYVAERLVLSACQIDYPKELIEVQILDDSTDDTVEIAAAVAQRMREQGFDVAHLHRKVRTGYKAGALKEALRSAKGEFIGIFDADFIPSRNFLKETIPYFVDPAVGMVQTRWGHLNCNYSMLTRAQSMGIDGHFGVEQAARAWGGLFMNFNGTAGIWRRKAIEDGGGWQADTLTEDLDLSYRAQLKGWKLEFAPGVVCPAELPVTINGFKSQQHRWAKGSIETAKKNLVKLFKAKLPLLVKIQSFLHLTHYMVHPLMIIVVLTSIPMLFTKWFFVSISYPLLFFTLFCLATFGPSNMYIFSQRILYPDWRKSIKYLPFLMCLGTGISVNNTKAILEALFGFKSGFVRTPKYGIERKEDTWYGKIYSIPFSAVSLIELLLGLYSLAGLLLFLLFSKYFISPFLFIYTAGFIYVFSLSVMHAYAQSRKS
ncbi:MAG: glycosyltransferase family 2 protein [Deltaproteobacteria bacterium]|nr:MAG: glycosyltransferase family 2 protein [Deltaproteobacteria bacterium]